MTWHDMTWYVVTWYHIVGIKVNKKYSDCEIAADRCFLLYLFHFHHLSTTSHSFCLPHLIVLYFLIVLSPLLFFAITVTLIPPPYLNLSLSPYLSIALPSSYHYYLPTSTFSHLGKHSLIVTAPDFILPACVVPLRGLHVPQDWPPRSEGWPGNTVTVTVTATVTVTVTATVTRYILLIIIISTNNGIL